MIYSDKEKVKICTELENARQNIRLLGSRARKSDRARLKRALAAYNRIMQNR